MDMNPVLTEIQGLSPQAKTAMGMAGYKLPDDSQPSLATSQMAAPIPLIQGAPAPNVSPPIRGTAQGDSLIRSGLMGSKPGVDNISSRIQGSNFGQNHPTLGKIVGGIAQGAGLIGDNLLHAAAPGVEQQIPGTEGNYIHQLRGANAALTQDEANAGKEAQTASENAAAQHMAAETPTVAPLAESREAAEGAATEHAKAETKALENPAQDWKELAGYTGPNGEPLEIDTKSGQTRVAPGSSGSKTAKPSKEDTPQQQTFDALVAQGMTPVQAYEKIREKPGGTTVNEGTWQLGEDKDGKPILWNSKTGQTQDNVTGIEKPGTKEKRDTALAAPDAASGYANDYLSRGVFTGPGDEALQEKFFELAKPSTGFRMTQPQMNMLANSRSWMNSIEAHLRHAANGTWFSPEQRQQIVSTMNDLAKAKKTSLAGGAGNSGAAPTRPAGVPDNATWNAQGNGGKGSWQVK